MPEESAILAPQGEIDLHVSPQIKERLTELVSLKPQKLVVDLSEVSYIDSSGLAIFIEVSQAIKAYGGSFRLCGLRENVRQIFHIACLDQIFKIFPDRSTALSAN